CISRTSLDTQSQRRRWRSHRPGKRSANRLHRRSAEQFVLAGLVMDAVEIRTSNDLARVQERDAFPLRDVAIALTEEKGLFLAPLEHFRVAGKLGDRRRRDQEDFRRASVRALPVGSSKKDEAAHALGDVEGGNGEALLQVVAAK